MHRRLVMPLALLSLGMVVAQSPPAAAAGGVPATIRVAEGYYPASRTTAPYTYVSEPCAVELPRSPAPNAYRLLVSAKAARCISSFRADRTPSGHYLKCVEGRCEAPGFYWAIYRNGELTCVGVDEVLVRPRDEITFSYEPYPTAIALATCGDPE